MNPRAGSRTRRLPARSHALLFSLPLLAVCLGCAGYTTKRIDAFPGARTIAVRPVDNAGYRRDLGLRLATALTDEIRARTSYAFAPPESADLVLETHMVAGEEILVQGRDREPIQKLLAGDVALRVLDRSGRVLRSTTVTAQEEFLVGGRYGQGLEGSGTDEWVRRMAIRIVQSLEAGF